MNVQTCAACCIILLLVLINAVHSELIQNGDFEKSLNKSTWICNGGCKVERSTHCYSGLYSARVYDRETDWSNLRQKVRLEAGGRYMLTAMVRLDNLMSGHFYHALEVRLAVQPSKHEKTVHRTVAVMPYLRPDQGWRNVSTVFTTQHKGKGHVYFRVSQAGVSFYVDSVSVTEVKVNSAWRQEANERIDQLRKANVSISVSVSEGHDPANLEIKLSQTYHDFPFGSVTHGAHVCGNDPKSERYRQYLYDMFNTAVISDVLKWKSMESDQFDIRFWRVEKVLRELEEHRLRVKGHCMTWGVEDSVPSWLVSKSGPEVLSHLHRRFTYLMQAYTNRFQQWDVCNEQLHGSFFEDKTKNPDILMDMFVNASKLDPNAKLFLNDFKLVNGETYTGAMVDSVRKMQEKGAPLYGIGIQSHFFSLDQIDIDVIAKRLDILSSAGVPMWISELDVSLANRTMRADMYEDVLRLYFSHPAVEGIIIWGFWNESHWRPNAALVEGDNLQENEAGKRIRRLWQKEWYSETSLYPDRKQHDFLWRAFHGTYNVTVIYNNVTIQQTMFHLSKGQAMKININI